MRRPEAWRIGFLCVATLLAVHTGATALSQVNPAPRNMAPGAIMQDFTPKRDGLDSRDLEAPPPAQMDYELPPLEDQVLTNPSSRIDVFIEGVDVKGSTLLSPKEISKVTEPFDKKRVEFSELEELANKLTKRYRDKGYVTSRVYIPSQKVGGKKVLMQAVEGRVGQKHFGEGNWFKPHAYSGRIDVKEGELLNIRKLSKSLALINEHPDLKIRTSLVAGQSPGETDLKFLVVDKNPLHAMFGYDNQGRKFIGNERLSLTLTNNNMLGFGDRNTFNVTGSKGSFGIVNHYEADVWKYGTKIGMDFGRSSLKLREEFRLLDVGGGSKTFSPFISQRLYGGRRLKADLNLAFDIKRSNNDVFGSPFAEDRIRVLRPSLTLQEFDRWGTTIFTNEVGIGLLFEGATSGNEVGSPRDSSKLSANRLGAGSRFARWTGSLTRLQRLPLDAFSIIKVNAQLTRDLLVSAEQFQVGGSFSVRGYREGRLIGDSGLVASIETHFPFYIFPKHWKLPFVKGTLRKNLEVVTFVDFGASYVNEPPVGQEASEYALGAGFGIRVRLTRFLTGRFDVAWPLFRAPADTARPRVHFGLQSSLL